jgi:hypothetical protein
MKVLRPLRAIRAKCLECSGGSVPEVRLCGMQDCPLWPYRMGRNPQRAGLGGHVIGRGKISRKNARELGVGAEKGGIQ